MALSSNWLGYLTLNEEITGSIPVRATKIMILAYEISDVCIPDESLEECQHFAESERAYTVLLEKKTVHMCGECLPAEAKVYNAEWPRRIRRVLATDETRVKSSSRRPSNRW